MDNIQSKEIVGQIKLDTRFKGKSFYERHFSKSCWSVRKEKIVLFLNCNNYKIII